MAIRRRSLRNARNLRGLRSSRSRRYGGNGSKGSKGSNSSKSGSSGKKTTKVKPNKRPVRAFSQELKSLPRGKATAVGHHDYVNVIRREYKALADLVEKHISDSELLKTEFFKLKRQSVFLK